MAVSWQTKCGIVLLVIQTIVHVLISCRTPCRDIDKRQSTGGHSPRIRTPRPIPWESGTTQVVLAAHTRQASVRHMLTALYCRESGGDSASAARRGATVGASRLHGTSV